VFAPATASAQPPPEQVVAWDGYDRSIRLTWLPAAGIEGPLSEDRLGASGLDRATRARGTLPAGPVWGEAAAPSSSAVTYRVYRSTTESGPFVPISDGAGLPWYRDDAVDNDRTYFYRVTRLDEGGVESPPSAVASARAARGGRRIESRPAAAAPVIDGRIAAAEWGGAAAFDITAAGASSPVTAYVMNSRTHLFVAVHDPNFPFPDDFNQIGIYFDENHDGAWNGPPLRPEGNVWVYYDATFYETSNLFRAITGTWPDHLSGIFLGASSAVQQALSYLSGDAEFEVAIDLSRVPLVSGPGRTIGLSIYSDQTGNAPYSGEWPPGIQSSPLYFSAPVLYGDVALGPHPAIAVLSDEPDEEIVAMPNPSRGSVAFRSSARRAGAARSSLGALIVYDLAGRRVARVDVRSAGTLWDWRDARGAELPSGTYFFQIDGRDGRPGRLVLVR
jgi:hypothetical protein